MDLCLMITASTLSLFHSFPTHVFLAFHPHPIKAGTWRGTFSSNSSVPINPVYSRPLSKDNQWENLKPYPCNHRPNTVSLCMASKHFIYASWSAINASLIQQQYWQAGVPQKSNIKTTRYPFSQRAEK